MSLYILADEFVGDPDTFYNLVVEEINKRGIEGVEYNWSTEVESTKLFFNKGDEARALRVMYRKYWINVLGYQIGNSFHVSTRFTWSIDPEKTAFLYEAIMDCFAEAVDRSTKAALVRHMEERSAAIPEGLRPESVFFTPSSQSA